MDAVLGGLWTCPLTQRHSCVGKTWKGFQRCKRIENRTIINKAEMFQVPFHPCVLKPFQRCVVRPHLFTILSLCPFTLVPFHHHALAPFNPWPFQYHALVPFHLFAKFDYTVACSVPSVEPPPHLHSQNGK